MSFHDLNLISSLLFNVYADFPLKAFKRIKVFQLESDLRYADGDGTMIFLKLSLEVH